MKDKKINSGNSEKIQKLGDLFAQTINKEAKNAREQIEHTRKIPSEIKKQKIQIEHKQYAIPETPTESIPEFEAPINPKEKQNENLMRVDPKPEKKLNELLRMSTYFLGTDIEKLKKLRKYLVENGVNSSITDSQLVRLAVKKLEIEPDVVDFYINVRAEDGRKHRSTV